MQLTKESRFYLVGICGAGMSQVAGLLKSSGAYVIGSDNNVYPPASSLLERLDIKVLSPYAKDNVRSYSDCTFVIGNSLSRDHVEVEEILQANLQHTSFPKLLGDFFLDATSNIVVAGTHGKTSTSSLIAFLLRKLGLNPGFMIGGLPHDLEAGYSRGDQKLFVLEGDEYDTAFFDKASKFLHYNPEYLVFNNLEYDHVDIFPTLAKLDEAFCKLLALVKDPEKIIANWGAQGVRRIVTGLGLEDQVTKTGAYDRHGVVAMAPDNYPSYDPSSDLWSFDVNTRWWGKMTVKTPLPGTYNADNICQGLALLGVAASHGAIRLPSAQEILAGIEEFRGVAKRAEHILALPNFHVYHDFAHHPTAVRNIIAALRLKHPRRRLLVAFEPKNATSRRSVFHAQFKEAFKDCDLALLAPCPEDKRLNPGERLDTLRLAHDIGSYARSFTSFADLESYILEMLEPGDVVAFLSCGDFAGIPRRLAGQIQQKVFDTSIETH